MDSSRQVSCATRLPCHHSKDDQQIRQPSLYLDITDCHDHGWLISLDERVRTVKNILFENHSRHVENGFFVRSHNKKTIRQMEPKLYTQIQLAKSSAAL